MRTKHASQGLLLPSTEKVSIDTAPVTCYVDVHDRRRGRRPWIGLCGDPVDDDAISDQPTCPACRRLLAITHRIDQLPTLAEISALPRRMPKPSTILSRAIAKRQARQLDEKHLRAWGFAVKTRDRWRDRKTGVHVLRTLSLDPLRAEAHHIVSKDDHAVRYDVRNGICLSLQTHVLVERGELVIEGTVFFVTGGGRYIDATHPVHFVRT
jgi:hypothetical protein